MSPSRGFLLLWELHIKHWEMRSRSHGANMQDSWRISKATQNMEEQQNQFVSENKTL